MPNAVLYTQIFTFLGYLGVLFYLYRVYVQQKDATIQQKDATLEGLREKISLLEKQLTIASDNSPDVLLLRLSNRIKLYEEELKLANNEKQAMDKMLDEQSKQGQQELNEFKAEIERITLDMKPLTDAIKQREHETVKLLGKIAC